MRNNSEIFLRMKDFNIYNSRIDMHMHTVWTDGKDTIIDMVKQADINRLASIAITDHIRKKSDYYPIYLKKIKDISSNYNMRIYSGFETKILNLEGELDILSEPVKGADFIIASVHRLPCGQSYQYPKRIPIKELALLEKNLALAAIKDSKSISVIGHCGGMSITTYGEFPIDYFQEVIHACADNDIAFEYNYKYHGRYEKKLKELLFRYNPYVSVGTDAHEKEAISNRSFCNE